MDMRTAVITGSTSGIGLGIAEAFVAEGFNIMLNGFGDATVIEETRARLGAAGTGTIGYRPTDMTKPDEIADLIGTATADLGPVDVLVKNAGIQHVAQIADFPPELWDAIIAINMTSAFHTIGRALPGMKSRKCGRIINVASAHGVVASPYKSADVTAKHGIIGLTNTVALEAAEDDVTCNAVCPEYVLTPLVEKQIPDTAKARGISQEEVKRDVLLAAQATKEFVTVEQLGALCVFVASDGAAQMTGTAVPVDGGWTAH